MHRHRLFLIPRALPLWGIFIVQLKQWHTNAWLELLHCDESHTYRCRWNFCHRHSSNRRPCYTRTSTRSIHGHKSVVMYIGWGHHSSTKMCQGWFVWVAMRFASQKNSWRLCPYWDCNSHSNIKWPFVHGKMFQINSTLHALSMADFVDYMQSSPVMCW